MLTNNQEVFKNSTSVDLIKHKSLKIIIFLLTLIIHCFAVYLLYSIDKNNAYPEGMYSRDYFMLTLLTAVLIFSDLIIYKTFFTPKNSKRPWLFPLFCIVAAFSSIAICLTAITIAVELFIILIWIAPICWAVLLVVGKD